MGIPALKSYTTPAPLSVEDMEEDRRGGNDRRVNGERRSLRDRRVAPRLFSAVLAWRGMARRVRAPKERRQGNDQRVQADRRRNEATGETYT